ncbi:MAG TPA: hypothetical protein VH143_35325 [Kofleriaceae bacterium]|nr:hypothetical protein [Kofleriaceae bacterium]
MASQLHYAAIMETISHLDFVVGGAGKAAPSSASNFGSQVSSVFSNFGSQVSSTFNTVTSSPQFHQAATALGDAAAGCAAGATKGIFGGPHAAAIGCAIGAGTGAIGDVIKDFSPLVLSATSKK